MRSMTILLAATLVASLAMPLAGCRRNQDGVSGEEGSSPTEAPTGQSFTSGAGTDTGAGPNPGPSATTGDAGGGLGATATQGDTGTPSNGSQGLGGANNAGGTVGATTGTAGDQGSPSGEAMQDTVISTKVKAALVADPNLKARDMSVDTREGEVTLTGVVDNEAQIDRAVQIAQGIEGVRNVNNRLTVRR